MSKGEQAGADRSSGSGGRMNAEFSTVAASAAAGPADTASFPAATSPDVAEGPRVRVESRSSSAESSANGNLVKDASLQASKAHEAAVAEDAIAVGNGLVVDAVASAAKSAKRKAGKTAAAAADAITDSSLVKAAGNLTAAAANTTAAGAPFSHSFAQCSSGQLLKPMT